jgi:hypothetical protein
MANKIFILRDFAWEYNDGEPMSQSGLGNFYKKFDTYQAAFAEKKAAEIAIARQGHANFEQLSGKSPYSEGIEKYWEYIKIHLNIDAKVILESNLVQKMQEPWRINWFLIEYSLARIKQSDEHIWNILQLIQLHFYEIQVFEQDKVFYKLYKTPNYLHRSRYWHERGADYDQTKSYSGELDWDGAYCPREYLPPAIFENFADAQYQIAPFVENRAGTLEELSDAPELLQAYIEQNNMLNYNHNTALLQVDDEHKDIPFTSSDRSEEHLTQIAGLLPLLKPIHLPFYVKTFSWKDLMPALFSEASWFASDNEPIDFYHLKQEQINRFNQEQEASTQLKALEIQYLQIYNAVFGTFAEEFAQKMYPLVQETDSKIYLLCQRTWKYKNEAWYPNGLGSILKKFNTLEAAIAAQKQVDLHLVREHLPIIKTLLSIQTGCLPIVRQVDKYADFIKSNFNFDINELFDSLFYKKHYPQDISNEIRDSLLNYTLKKFVLTNETILCAVLEMIELCFYEIKEVTTETAFYQLVLNPNYVQKNDSPIWYDDRTMTYKDIPFILYDNWDMAQNALANQLIYHRFYGTLETLSNIPAFLELHLGGALSYDKYQQCLSFSHPSNKVIETAHHLLLLLKPNQIPLRIEAFSLAAYEETHPQLSEKVISDQFAAQFSNISGVIHEIEADEWPF